MPFNLHCAGLKVLDVQKLHWLSIQENLERWDDRKFRPNHLSQFVLRDKVPCDDGSYFCSMVICLAFIRSCEFEGTGAVA